VILRHPVTVTENELAFALNAQQAYLFLTSKASLPVYLLRPFLLLFFRCLLLDERSFLDLLWSNLGSSLNLLLLFSLPE